MALIDSRNSNTTILICEDETDLLEDLAMLVADAGYQVIAETSADAAIGQLQTIRPDLILSDIAMPGTDGMAFLRHVRETRPDLDDVPFILLTAFADTTDATIGKRAGADDYLVKPVDYDLLIATIESQLRQVARLRGTGPVPAASVGEMGLISALDMLHFGIILLNAHGGVCFANRTALRRLEDCTMANVRQNLSEAVGASEFSALLGQCRRDARQGLCFRRAFIEQHVDDTDSPPRVIAFVALGQEPADPDAPMLMVLILDSGAVGQLGREMISEAAGLTAAESGVARMLANGHRSGDIAQMLSVSPTTVNFHLKNIFQKTEISRQADLIGLLRSIPLDNLPRPAHPPDKTVLRKPPVLSGD